MTQQDELARELGAALSARGWLCATAESCTGGLVAGAITAISGSSGWFDCGFVTYSDAAKVAMLGVPSAVLDAHGAVSEATAIAMAEGALSRSDAEIAVAITGIAGPAGAVPGKPVGTVCFAWARRDAAAPGASTWVETRLLSGDRAAVRSAAILVALEGLVALARDANSPFGLDRKASGSNERSIL